MRIIAKLLPRMFPRSLLVAVTFAAVVAAPALWAADAPTASKPSTPPATGAAGLPSNVTAHPITIDFPGGSIAQLVALINSSDNGPFNLIGEKSFQETALPPFSLHNVEPASLAVALNALLRPRELAFSLAGPNIFILAKSVSPSSLYAPAAPTFQAFQLAPYLTKLSVEDIIDAIVVAWESFPGNDPKQLGFKYHSATKLLFVYGPPEAIAIATKLIPQLDPAATTRAQLEFSRASTKSTLPVLGPTVQEEADRLNAVTQEVKRRREIREAAKAVLPPSENK